MAEKEQEETIGHQYTLSGHTNGVTSIAIAPDDSNTIITGSRDKTIAVWKLSTGDKKYAKIKGTVVRRLWYLQTGDCRYVFKGHKQEVLSCAFIFFFFFKKKKKMEPFKNIFDWNTVRKGEMLSSLKGNESHKDWVNCVRFSPDAKERLIVSCGQDKTVKMWSLKDDRGTLKYTLAGHTNCVNSVIVSPDGSLCASGGKDGVAMLWNMDNGKELAAMKAGGEINYLCFSPTRFWCIICMCIRMR
ncbi:receptor for activated C kinase 1 [Reticulomyxa filosa]|uniref:Receptor for activated C kinase 1 n=1 Tax=Reticulomyxa filosa TaxID=46433 RepID=X6LVJ5_RETFI|nr:receptor for activated C kinase 1 [Reticulomyxa filosa]|eukprot:ETO05177.1 receptor for activated C kinase 1 [Reticulomyxa filosa]